MMSENHCDKATPVTASRRTADAGQKLDIYKEDLQSLTFHLCRESSSGFVYN